MTRPRIVDRLLVGCALAVATLVLLRRVFTEPREGEHLSAPVAMAWEELVADGQAIGPEDAPITIIEFSDFQCPFCARSYQILADLRNAFPQQIRHIFRHYPLPAHPHAFDAAVAAECAALYGKFWQLHRLFFENQSAIGARSWADFAAEAGIEDLDGFAACTERADPAERVRRDRLLGQQIGVNGTPSFAIDGRLYRGVPALGPLRLWVERRLAAR